MYKISNKIFLLTKCLIFFLGGGGVVIDLDKYILPW